MADGDDAVLAGMEKVDGAVVAANTIDDLINRTRDYIAQGKGAVSAATANKVAKRDAFGRLQVATPSAASDAANKAYVDAIDVSWGGITGKPSTFPPSSHTHDWSQVTGKPSTFAPSSHTHASLNTGPVSFGWNSGTSRWHTPEGISAASAVFGGDVNVGGHVYVPNSTPATSSYVIAYIDGTGRLAKGASTERVKKFIKDIDPLGLGNLFPVFKRWQMRFGDGVWRYGYTAEQLATDPVTEPFVIYERHVEEDGTAPHLERDSFGRPIPESIDFIGLLLAQVAQLHARDQQREAELQALAARIDALEAR